MSKKPGQPDSALEITAGRRSLLNTLVNGTAEGEAQAMAANWLRDLYRHYNISVRVLERNGLYRDLYIRRLHSKTDMDLVHEWIMNLVSGILMTHERTSIMSKPPTEDELISQGMRATLPGANSMQVGGSHYAKPIQHWDFVASNEYPYLEGQITKYVFRWRDKNGVQDVQKAAHFLQKLIEVSAGEVEHITLMDFLNANSIPEDERSIYVAIHAYHATGDNVFLAYANDAMKKLLATAGAPAPS